MDIKKYLSEKKAAVDKALENYFAREFDCPSKLKEAMLYSLRAGGKRVRPILAIASCEACGGKIEDAMPVALGLEMIHTFSLIHDDLPAMDNDDLRRGLPTSHKKFGEATAILTGDALLAEAFLCLGNGLGKMGNGMEIVCDIALATGACGMTGGQLLDMDATDKKISYNDLRNIHRGKTGALITVSVTSGARAASAGKKELVALTKYGEAVGLAFQISDDILDIEGTTEELGKPAKSDIGNKKSTYPSILGLDKSKKLAREQVDAAYSALAEFDSKADPLREIARYIINRKN